jgi:hypothetical protein
VLAATAAATCIAIIFLTTATVICTEKKNDDYKDYNPRT